MALVVRVDDQILNYGDGHAVANDANDAYEILIVVSSDHVGRGCEHPRENFWLACVSAPSNAVIQRDHGCDIQIMGFNECVSL